MAVDIDSCILTANKKTSDLTHEVIRKMKFGQYCEKEILMLEVLNKWRILLEEQKCANAGCGLTDDEQEQLCKQVNTL